MNPISLTLQQLQSVHFERRERLRQILGNRSGEAFVTARESNQQRVIDAITLCYQSFLNRSPDQEGLLAWLSQIQNGLSFERFVLAISDSAESKAIKAKQIRSMEFIEEDVVSAYELFRGVTMGEVKAWSSNIRLGKANLGDLLSSLFEEAHRMSKPDLASSTAGENTCTIMGTNRVISERDWIDRLNTTSGAVAEVPAATIYHSRFHIKEVKSCLVSAITSLYRGGAFIEQFMENIVAQNYFDDMAELIIVDADSPEKEADVINRYLKAHKNIKYVRLDERVGIYRAWNQCVELSCGEFITNANLDDLRRRDSFELQAATLQSLPFVDVVYQEFLYSLGANATYDQVEKVGFKSSLPVVTAQNLLNFNPPHNAPMWRRALHSEVGFFDESLKSAGDYDFWCRCAIAGKVFFKLNDPHVVYYNNPRGLSTQPNTPGVKEARLIGKKYSRSLLGEPIVLGEESLLELLKNDVLPDSSTSHLSDRYSMAQLAIKNLSSSSRA
jgi:hypothetical protein